MFSLVSLGLIRCLAVRAGGGWPPWVPHGGAAGQPAQLGAQAAGPLAWRRSGQGGGHGQQVEHHAQIEGGVRRGKPSARAMILKAPAARHTVQGEGHPGLAEGEAAHQETGDHGQQGPQHGD